MTTCSLAIFSSDNFPDTRDQCSDNISFKTDIESEHGTEVSMSTLVNIMKYECNAAISSVASHLWTVYPVYGQSISFINSLSLCTLFSSQT